MSGGQSLIGDYDKKKKKFLVTSHHKFNFGSAFPGGLHAPSATPDGNGGIIVIFNMNPAKDTKGWDQVMTLPRKINILLKIFKNSKDYDLGKYPDQTQIYNILSNFLKYKKENN